LKFHIQQSVLIVSLIYNLKKLYLSFFIVVIDQLSKIYIRQTLNEYESKEIVWPGILNFTFVENRNIAFGLDLGFFNSLVVWISILIVIFIFYVVITELESLSLSSYAMPFILGGAIGNIIDRLCVFFDFAGYNGVTDFIDMPNILYYIGIMENSRWFIFNIADISISIGAGIFILSSILENNKDKTELSVV